MRMIGRIPSCMSFVRVCSRQQHGPSRGSSSVMRLCHVSKNNNNRRWTSSRTATISRPVLDRIKSFPVTRPFIFGTVFAGLKNGLADVIVQCTIEDKTLNEIDTRRTVLFSAFGFVFCGIWQYTLFVKLMPKLCPQAISFAQKPLSQKLTDFKGLKQLAIQVMVENGINNPFLYFPTFYTIKCMLETNTYDLRVTFPMGLRRAYDNFTTDVPAILKVWVPAQIINFGFSPIWFRVPFVACVSFGWTCYVSFLRGEFDDGKEDESGDDQSDEMNVPRPAAVGVVQRHHNIRRNAS